MSDWRTTVPSAWKTPRRYPTLRLSPTYTPDSVTVVSVIAWMFTVLPALLSRNLTVPGTSKQYWVVMSWKHQASSSDAEVGWAAARADEAPPRTRAATATTGAMRRSGLRMWALQRSGSTICGSGSPEFRGPPRRDTTSVRPVLPSTTDERRMDGRQWGTASVAPEAASRDVPFRSPRTASAVPGQPSSRRPARSRPPRSRRALAGHRRG